MKKQNRKIKHVFCIRFLLIVGITLLFTSCATREAEEEQTELSIYYIDKEYTSVIETKYQTTTRIEETDQILKELLNQLSLPPNDVVLKTPLNSSFHVEKYILDKKQLSLDFSRGYEELEPLREVLIRAAIVQTLLQLEEVESVLFTIDGISIMDSMDQVIGRMDQNTFINTTGSQINSYEKVTIQIYFANEVGDALLPVQRMLVYSSNISMEKLVVDQIIVGPANADSFPTVNVETLVTSVTVKDGICYVNLSEEFLNQIEQVTAETTIYSIVNSLIEINNINKVQISVDSETEGVYIGNVSLGTVFERNLEIIER
jgi:germination protein M